jgi:hypothetical protein
VEPVVAFTDKIPLFKPDAREVAKVLQIPFEAFLDEKSRREEVWKREGYSMIAPFFHIEDYVIWGATAMMISELIELVKRK